MKDKVVNALSSTGLKKEEIEKLVEVPPSSEMGDFAFPCFVLAKSFRKNPSEIASELVKKISSTDFEKIESKGPYINFFINRNKIAEKILNEILKEKEKYGSSKYGKGKVITIDLSAPNIAKPFGIGHLRSTIIGNSISKICSFIGFKPVKINFLGDWGTQFGKLIVGYKKFGDEKKFKSNPLAHLQEIYVKVNQSPELDEESRIEFRKLEEGDKKNIILWKKFKEVSLKEFEKVYKILNIKFDVISGESFYNKKMDSVVSELNSKNLLKESDGAQVVDLEKYNLGVCLIKKSDGATLYATRDITAAIDRHKKYKFDKMIYEVGSEQSLHFKQFFKVLELMGYSWAKNLVHVSHGLYLGEDGKKFATRKGKTVYMADILKETISLAKKEISKREKLSEKELDKRAESIALSAILYGDLKNYRSNDILFDIERFLSFEGNTGPYLLYTYARAKSILRKAKYKKSSKLKVPILNDMEKSLIIELGKFQETIYHAYEQLAPNTIANYSYELAQKFNEYYHSEKIIGDKNEDFKLSLVESFTLVLKNSLNLLGISVIEKM